MWLVCGVKVRTGHVTHVFILTVKVALVKFGNMTAEILRKAGANIEVETLSHIIGAGRTFGGAANAAKIRVKLSVPC